MALDPVAVLIRKTRKIWTKKYWP